VAGLLHLDPSERRSRKIQERSRELLVKKMRNSKSSTLLSLVLTCNKVLKLILIRILIDQTGFVEISQIKIAIIFKYYELNLVENIRA